MKIKIKSSKMSEKVNPEGVQTFHFEEKDCGIYEAEDEEGNKLQLEVFFEEVEEEQKCGVCESCKKQRVLEEAEYQGKKVTLRKPFYTPGGPKKKAVYVRAPNGKVKKVTFGDPNMKIKKSSPERRKSFKARHNCDNPGPITKARYWSCKAW